MDVKFLPAFVRGLFYPGDNSIANKHATMRLDVNAASYAV